MRAKDYKHNRRETAFKQKKFVIEKWERKNYKLTNIIEAKLSLGIKMFIGIEDEKV